MVVVEERGIWRIGSFAPSSASLARTLARGAPLRSGAWSQVHTTEHLMISPTLSGHYILHIWLFRCLAGRGVYH